MILLKLTLHCGMKHKHLCLNDGGVSLHQVHDRTGDASRNEKVVQCLLIHLKAQEATSAAADPHELFQLRQHAHFYKYVFNKKKNISHFVLHANVSAVDRVGVG